MRHGYAMGAKAENLSRDAPRRSVVAGVDISGIAVPGGANGDKNQLEGKKRHSNPRNRGTKHTRWWGSWGSEIRGGGRLGAMVVEEGD